MKQIIIFLLLIFISISLLSQKWKEVASIDDEATLALYEYRYINAGELYEKALEMVPQSDNLRYKAAVAYFQSQDSLIKAISLFKQSINNIAPLGTYNYSSIKELRAPIDALYFLGRAYHAMGEFQKAEDNYKSFISQTFDDDDLKLIAEQQVKSIEYARFCVKYPEIVEFNNIGKHINNNMPNYCAVISGDKNTLAYTSSTSEGLKVYISKKNNNGWANPKDITWDIGGGYLKTAWLSYNGKTLYLIEDNMIQKIVVAEYEDGGWKTAKRLKKPFNESANQAGITVSRDGKTIYFTSDRDGGIGGLDIYVSTMDQKGKWSKPTNLGTSINTPLNEEMVMLSHDEKKLYFSSEGYQTIGGSDIYVWEIGSNEPPKNLEYPINNAFNNNFYFPIDDNSGLLSAIRPEGQGQMDIYEISFQQSFNLKIDILAKDNVDINTPILLQIDNLSGEKLYTTPNAIVNTTNNVGKYLPGTYSIIIESDGIKSINEKINIPAETKDNIVSLKYFVESNKPKDEPKIAEIMIEKKPEIVKEEVNKTNEEKNQIKESRPSIIKEDNFETPAIIPAENIQNNKNLVASINENKILNTNTTEKTDNDKNSSKIHTGKNNVETETVRKNENKRVIIPVQTDSRKGNYTIQFMVLDLPVINKDVSNLGNINVFYTSGGLYKYTTGIFENKESATQTLEKVHSAGYPNAFICEIPLKGNYAIQLIALKNPKELLTVSDSISDLNMMYGSDGFFRYFIGGFKTIGQARQELIKVKNMGHPQAFIREIPKE